jgi:copper resistance protein B
MWRGLILGGMLVASTLAGPSAAAQPVVWGFHAEQLELRIGDGDAVAWDFDAFVGGDELRGVWRSEAEYGFGEHGFETLENQFRLQVPVSDFFNAVAGIRVDTPGGPDRVYGVLGLHGLAPQWLEVDADLFIAESPSLRLEVEYEALITNRLILTPVVELDVPFRDDRKIGIGAWAPKLEVGLRLSYDLVDRVISPYVGVHYEQVFGETADLVRADGDDVEALRFVVGTRIVF